MAKKKEKLNLTESLEQLNGIVGWFEEQEDVDVEVGLEKVREASKLIKSSKTRLTEIENEFKEIEKDIDDNVEEQKGQEDLVDDPKEDLDPDNIPF